jgi:hypothetical protein
MTISGNSVSWIQVIATCFAYGNARFAALKRFSKDPGKVGLEQAREELIDFASECNAAAVLNLRGVARPNPQALVSLSTPVVCGVRKNGP